MIRLDFILPENGMPEEEIYLQTRSYRMLNRESIAREAGSASMAVEQFLAETLLDCCFKHGRDTYVMISLERKILQVWSAGLEMAREDLTYFLSWTAKLCKVGSPPLPSDKGGMGLRMRLMECLLIGVKADGTIWAMFKGAEDPNDLIPSFEIIDQEGNCWFLPAMP